MKRLRTKKAWAVLIGSRNRLDGRREFLLGSPDQPCDTTLFKSRQEARDFVAAKFGYIRQRPDLRREPHGWKMPKVVRVTIDIRVAAA